MNRTLIRVSGSDADKFLQGLLTRDVPADGLGYAALLSPQGKYLADFLTFRDDEGLWLDVDDALASGLVQRLSMYRLRADATVEATDRPVHVGTGTAPDGAMADPRPGMGWRFYGDGPDYDATDWDAVRVANGIPASGIELIPNESYILEMGFERLGGVDFKKGCFVGQEVMARMKHKTTLRKGLARVTVDGDATPGAAIEADGRPVGTLHTRSGDSALAYLRFDRADGAMTAGGARLTLDTR